MAQGRSNALSHHELNENYCDSTGNTTNTDYEKIRLEGLENHEYALIDVLPEPNSSPTEGSNRSPSHPSPHGPPPTVQQDLAPPAGGGEGVARKEEKENVYYIPESQ